MKPPFLNPFTTAALLPIAAFTLLISPAMGGNTWDGGGADSNWGNISNWNPDGAPGYGTILFSGTTRTTNTNNSITAMNIVQWNNSTGWTMNSSGGTVLSLFDFGGGQAKLENLGSGLVTINAPITFAANTGNPYGEINAVSGNISFSSGTLTVNGSSVNGIKFFGGAGKDVTFANTVSASGKWFGFTNTNGSSVTIASGASVTTGDFYVMNGNTLNLSGGSLTTSAIRLGGDFGNTGNQNQTFGGTLALTPLTGGVNFSSIINTVTGNTSNALLIDSKNTSGTNTLSGSLFLDSNLRTLTASGGTLAFTTGTTDIKARTLTVDGSGTTTISQILSSSLGAGGSIVKTGSGILVLTNTSNNHTGTNNTTLNANGNQIAGGTLGIHGDGSLGLAPAGAYNNIQFTGSGTLQDTANNISLNANRNISIASAATATLDSNGNTFTVNGVINGTGGNLAITGGGSVVLTGNNSYTGTTSVATGATLLVNGDQSTATGNVTVTGTLAGTGTIGGNTTISSGAIHSVGNGTAGSVGQETFKGNLTYDAGSIFAWDLTSASTTTGFDKVVGSSGKTFTAAGEFRVITDLAFSAPFWDSPLTWSTIFSSFSTMTGWSAPASVNVFGTNGVLRNVATEGSFTISGTSLTWTAVPEPSSALAGLLLAAGFWRRRR